MIVAGTGHRPEGIPSQGHARLVARYKLQSKPVTVFICGMAAGFDLIAADEALALGIDVWAARPWEAHSAGKEWNELHDKVLKAATKVHIVSPGAPRNKNQATKMFYERNHWMVDHADVVMAYWNPETTSGGTYECIQYALNKKVPVANTWNDPPF